MGRVQKIGYTGPRQRTHFWTRPGCVGAMRGWHLRNTPIPTRVILAYSPEFVRSTSNGVTEINYKFDSSLSASNKVTQGHLIGTDTDRSATRDYLLTSHIATGSLSCTISRIYSEILAENCEFSHPISHIKGAHIRLFHMELDNTGGPRKKLKKLERWGCLVEMKV